MPGLSDDEDGDVGSILIPACHGHRGHSGGGKPTPPTVNPMRHAGPPSGTEWQAPCHRSVRQGSGEKEAEARGGGSEGELGTVL